MTKDEIRYILENATKPMRIHGGGVQTMTWFPDSKTGYMCCWDGCCNGDMDSIDDIVEFADNGDWIVEELNNETF